MTIIYPDMCYNKMFYKGTALFSASLAQCSFKLFLSCELEYHLLVSGQSSGVTSLTVSQNVPFQCCP